MSQLPTRRKVFELIGEGSVSSGREKRQDELLKCSLGERVLLLPRRMIDGTTRIIVMSGRGMSLGEMCVGDAELIAPEILAGRRRKARLHSLKGGLPRYPRYGATISITWDGKPELSVRPLDGAQLEERQRRRSVRFEPMEARRSTENATTIAEPRKPFLGSAFCFTAMAVLLAYAMSIVLG